METNRQICGWVKRDSQEYVAYHDTEWGRAIHDDNALFELFSLETQSTGLSWLTVLKKRDGYREAFRGFDLKSVAMFDADDVALIMDGCNVVKSRPKIEAIIQNAKLFLEIQKEFGSLNEYFWGKVGHKTIINDVANYKQTQCTSEISDVISKELKKLGFKFIGSITIYAFMQACGMVDDHENGCYCKSRKDV